MLKPFMFTWENDRIDELKKFIELSGLPKEFLIAFDSGWGNGYVAVHKGHPWYGIDMHRLNSQIQSESDITFAQFWTLKHPNKLRSTTKKMWVLGFDTSHHSNTPETWPKERVEENTKNILIQALYLIHPYKSDNWD